MKIQMVSDLHLECDVIKTKAAKNADVIVLAGDIVSPTLLERLIYVIESLKKPIIYVAGNHDYWGAILHKTIEDIEKDLHTLSKKYDHFHFLNCQSLDIGDYRFLGCTLWSDFGLAPDYNQFCEYVDRGYWDGKQMISLRDFERILKTPTRFLTAKDCSFLAYQHKEFLDREISISDKKTIIITHFCPSEKSIAAEYNNDIFNPYYICDCEKLMRDPVKLWIHGHTHVSFDYQINNVRVVCNPRGYLSSNIKYNGKKIVEV